MCPVTAAAAAATTASKGSSALMVKICLEGSPPPSPDTALPVSVPSSTAVTPSPNSIACSRFAARPAASPFLR